MADANCETVEINGTTYEITRRTKLFCRASARLRGKSITVTVPVCITRDEALRIFTNLRDRMIRKIKRFGAAPQGKSELRFSNGQTIEILGRQFSIVVVEGIANKNSTARLKGSMIRITPSPTLNGEKCAMHVSNLARKVMSKAVLPILAERVMRFNTANFNSTLGRVRLKDNMCNWGSCSRANNINLDFRLLFAPGEILDYVIVHELAHTKHRNHSKAFHATLAGVIPDYKERRRWLRKNCHLLKPGEAGLSFAAKPPAQEITKV